MRRVVELAVAATLAGCGHDAPVRSAPRDPVAAPPPRAASPTASDAPGAAREARGVQVQADIGGLDADAVDAVIGSANRDLDQCWQRATDQNALIAGKIDLVLGVGGDGRLAWGYVKQSTLGDGDAQRCLIAALSARTWPKPVGGKVGIVRTSLAFELPNDVRPPIAWSRADMADVLAGAAREIAACKRDASGAFAATVYVKQVELPQPDAGADGGEDAGDAGPRYAGAAMAVGIAVPDEHAAEAGACLERALSHAVYPPPGDWPAKATFSL